MRDIQLRAEALLLLPSKDFIGLCFYFILIQALLFFNYTDDMNSYCCSTDWQSGSLAV